MSTIIDINVTPTIQEVTINTVDNITVINVNTQSGGGGSQTLSQTLVLGNTTDGQNISISEGDAIVLDNSSKLKKGTTDAGNGGNKGIALKCSLDYELKWEAGRLYFMEQNGTNIRAVLNNFTNIPTNDDDQTKGYVAGSTWVLDNGDIYVCTDRTANNAVWVQKGGIGDVLDINQNAIDKLINFISADENASNIVDFNGSTIEAFNGGGVNLLKQNLSYADYNTITLFDEAGSIVNSIKRSHDSERYTKGILTTTVTYDNPTGNGTIKYPNVANATKTVAMTSDIPTIDANPTDGSSNAVSSNGVFDALATKEPTITAGTTFQYYRGDKTFQTLDKTAVGLGNVDNTSDANKPVSTATQTALDLKANTTYVDAKVQNSLTASTSVAPSATAVNTALALKQNDLWNFKNEGVVSIEDYISLSNAVLTNSANVTVSNSYPNRTNQIGVAQYSTGVSATGVANSVTVNLNLPNLFIGDGAVSFEVYVNINTLSTSGERFYSQFGFMSNTNNANTSSGIFFMYDEGGVYASGAVAGSANWKCVTINSLTRTFTNTSVAVSATNWVKLRFEINSNASSVEFFINNVSVATHTTNIPTSSTGIGIFNGITKTVGTTARLMFVDYVVWRKTLTSTR